MLCLFLELFVNYFYYVYNVFLNYLNDCEKFNYKRFCKIWNMFWIKFMVYFCILKLIIKKKNYWNVFWMIMVGICIIIIVFRILIFVGI